MKAGRFIVREAVSEFTSSLRGPVVPLVSAGLIGYVGIIVTSAEYVRNMGGADVARNSHHMVFLMATGQAIFFLFAWAWVFAQVVTRDRKARLHELVLAAPLSVPRLFLARYLGALALGVGLGLVALLGFLIVHPLQAAGALPPNAVGPTPWAAILWAWLVLVVPSAIGTGALYLAAALRTRAASGPFAVAAGLAVVWMVAMVILRGGDISPALATLLDPSGFAEVKEQTDAWTPTEKMGAHLALTWPLLANRLLWGGGPLILLAFVLLRLRREALVLEQPRRSTSREGVEARLQEVYATGGEVLPPVRSRAWLGPMLLEAKWHLSRSLGSWGVWLTFVLISLGTVSGSFVNVVGHAEGPMVPRPELLIPLLGEFSYLAMAFIIAGFVGVLMRRDEELGYWEIVGATPVPLGARLVGRVLAAFGLVVSLMLVPIVSTYVVAGVAAPASFSWTMPVVFFLFVYTPALLELCAMTIVCHAVIRSAGVAYAVSMLATFFFIVNNELGIVTYPLATVGVPARVSLAALVGWTPWVPLIVGQGLFKLGVFGLAVAVAWLAWPRGWTDHWTERFASARGRLRSGASVALVTSCAAMVGLGIVLYDRLAVRGDYEDPRIARQERGEWERRWVPEASPFAVEGGEVVVVVNPSARTASARWTLRGVRASRGRLHGELPNGVVISQAMVRGRSVVVESAHGSFGLPVEDCAAAPGCEVVLELAVVRRGWPVDGETPWLHPSQVWMTAGDVLPRLGLDPGRALRGPEFRTAHRLASDPPRLPAGAAVSALGVAPAGQWSWNVELPNGWHLPNRGQVDGPLDFAVAWRPAEPEQTRHDGLTAWHGPGRHDTAVEILEDLEAMRACVFARLPGPGAEVHTVMSTPREGTVGVRGSTLWLPEDRGWDVAANGYGRWHRRRTIARSLAAEALARRAKLRAEPGARWLEEGVAGWIGLSCVRASDGDAAWLALFARDSEEVVEALGALSAPVRDVTQDGGADWVAAYAPLATSAWATAIQEPQGIRLVASIRDAVAQGASVPDAMREALGSVTTQELLGGPRASDLRLEVKSDATKSLERGSRWRWADGGWHEDAPPTEALLLPHGTGDVTRSPMRVLIPSALETRTPFTLLDPWPAFERSIYDNVWDTNSPVD